MQGLKTLISGPTAGKVGLLEIKFSHQEELDKIRLRDKYHMSNRGVQSPSEMGQESRGFNNIQTSSIILPCEDCSEQT